MIDWTIRRQLVTLPKKSTPPRTLLEKIIRESDLALEEHCVKFDILARESGERDASLSTRQLARWMAGEVTSAHPASRRVAKSLWGFNFWQLVDSPSLSEAE